MKYLTVYLLLFALLSTGCSPQPQKHPMTHEERTALYQASIESARDEQINRVFPLITTAEEDNAQTVFDRLNISPEDMSAYALSACCDDDIAYAAAAIYPAAGCFDLLLEQLRYFVCNRQQNFKQTSPKQYEIAVDTRLESLEDGTILLIMSEHQDEIFDAVRDSIESAN